MNNFNFNFQFSTLFTVQVLFIFGKLGEMRGNKNRQKYMAYVDR